MASKEIKYYKIQLDLKFKFLWGLVRPKTGLKLVWNWFSTTEIQFAKKWY